MEQKQQTGAGKKGRPAGAWTGKEWRDAIRRAVNERAAGKSGPKRLVLLARALVQAGQDGDVAALKELGDRLDGKVSQPVTGEDGGPIVVEVVRFTDKDSE